MHKAITEARSIGHSDDDILRHIVSTNPDIEKQAEEALRSGYKSKDILDFISVTTKEGKLPQELSTGQPLPESGGGGLVGGFKRGFGSGVTGLVGGAKEQLPREEGFFEHVGALAGETISDLPAMLAGGFVGGTAGSAIPVVGTAIGSGAGAIAAPAIIKQAFAEYRDHARQGTNLTFGEFLERSASVGVAGGKAAVTGAILSQASKLIPTMKKLPGFSKLLGTKLGPAIEKPIAEAAALAGAHVVTEQEIPSLKQMGDNLAVIAGFRVSDALVGKTQKIMQEKGSTLREAAKEAGIKIKEKSLSRDDLKTKFREDIKREHPDAGGDVEKAKDVILKNKERLKEPDRPKLRKVVETVEKAREGVDKIKNKIDERIQKYAREDEFFKTIREPIEKARSSHTESKFKWRNEFVDAQESHGKKFSDTQLEEALYYRQKTGNPKVKGDTFNELSERLPEPLKKMDKVLDKHLENWFKVWKENVATSDIGFVENYLTGVYEEAPAKIEEIHKNVAKQFKNKSQFTNPKVFKNYAEAYEKAGLTPRYKNIVDLMRHYDDVMIKVQMNNEIVKSLKDIEKTKGSKLIVTPSDGEAYTEAKKSGWVEYQDPFLRKFKTVKDGKVSRGTHAESAYVHPDLHPALKGIFNKKAITADPKWLQKYDSINSLLKMMRVSLSPFHYIPISESAMGAMGFKFLKGLPGIRNHFPDNWRTNAETLRANEEFMKDASKYIEVEAMPDHEQIKKGEDTLSKLFDKMPQELRFGGKKVANLKPGYDWVMKLNRHLFNTYQPLLKVATFDHYVKEAVAKHLEAGIEVTPELLKEIKRKMGSLTNNQLGGQIKELSRSFNDPVQRKWMQRFVGYPDWTISALKQAGGIAGKGIKGDMSRSYWARYVAGLAMTKAMMSLVMGGFGSEDKENDKLTWSPKKAVKALNDNDPSQWYSFPLPDMNIKVGKVSFNPGRDEKGRKRFSHFGKQMLEIPRYATNPGDAIFGKSSPVIQATLKQLFGATPYQGEAFPTRGKFVGGSIRPWDGTFAGTAGRAVSRAKTAAGEFVPFGVRGLESQGFATWVASGFGAVPVAKGMSLRKAEPYVYNALKKRDMKKLNKIVDVLKDNGYEVQQIKRMITTVKKYKVEKK